ncbi:MAG TPA: heat-inducible transcriptional repressor HrcA [Bacillota bacterium]|nr:heat-inducible transcriptional repressor HrcA [Bacillota bacterium]HPF42520.1 heat-inducible transcriptional repressor HrcA [Bacillota bacterium]HPJ85994.1 heat-inducible transcriptional repressor HrcA [Bacillota bacterium]HPQ61985.1 heat-inducible transcriptional repressor HrcA [Bacillota bacterium]HRX92115.1 heat-inducible transcriptional repressor HrcA [Candidatus Izemoplasmatales bacterium]
MLTERQETILKLIVDEYVKTAEPVGSKALSFKMEISSATIRNEMSALEDAGYLEKTHTSSGRIPSEQGYRYYIEKIIRNIDEESDGYFEFEKLFENKEIEREELIKEAIDLLSQVTNCTAISLGPEAYYSKVKKVQMIPLKETQALILVVTNFGHVESKQITISENMEVAEMVKVIDLLNEMLVNTPISQVSEKLHYEIQHSQIKELLKYRESIVDSFIEAFSKFAQTRYYLTGQSNMLYQPEFNDIQKLRKFIETVENNDIFKLVETDSDGVSVKIGTENQVTSMKDCTVVSSTYDTIDGEKGTISVVGPTRMDYRKVIPLLKYIAKNIAKLYEEE